MKLTMVVIAATGLFAAAEGAPSLNCDDCGYVRTCFVSVEGCAQYNAFIHAWINSYASCNSGRHCGSCFPECAIEDDGDYLPPTATAGSPICVQAGICFADAGCANYNAGNEEWTREYANCNGVKACAPYFPECAIPGVDYSPPYQRLHCTSAAKFRSDVEVKEGLTCRDAGMAFEPSTVDCADDAQRSDVRGSQLTCCGGADVTETFCSEYPAVSGASDPTPDETVQSEDSELSSGAPEYPAVSGASDPTPDETVQSEHSELSLAAVLAICVGSAALAFMVFLGIGMHFQRKRKKQHWQTATAPKLTQSLEFGSSNVPPTQSTAIGIYGMELDKDTGLA